MALGLGSSLVKGGASLLTFVKDNLKLYLDFKSNRSDTLKFPSEGSTSFDGNDYISAGQSSDLGAGTNFTISLWVKNEGTAKSYVTQIQKGEGSSGLAILANSLNTGVNAGYVTALVWNGTSHLHLSFDGSIDDGKWHHIAFTTTSSAQVLYFDGQSVDTDTIAFTNAFDSNPIFIGARGNASEFFTGKMANMAIWSRALTPEEVQSIMNKSYSQLKGVEKTSLIAWWALDDVQKVTDNSVSSGLIESETGEILSSNVSSFNSITGTGNNYTNNIIEFVVDGYAFFNISGIAEGKLYRFTYNVLTQTASGMAHSGGSSAFTGGIPTTVGSHEQYLVAGSANLLVMRSQGFRGTITDIVLQEVSMTGVVTGATTTTSVYGGNAPILPRAVDVAKEGQADAIGNGSALFNGTSDYIDVGSGSLLDDIWTGGGTITGWINSHSIGENTGFFVVKRSTQPSGWHISNKDESGNTCKLRFAVRWDNFGQWTTTSRDITYNEWIHIAVSYDNGSTSNNPTIYINGVSVAITTVTTPSGTYVSDASDNLYIGGDAGDFTTDGNISQLGIWKGELTQAQIQSIMESTSYSKIPADIKSTLGAERVLNSDFSDGENLWTLNNANVVSEVLEIDEGAFSYYAQQSVDGGGSNYRQFESGYLMKLEIVVDEYTSGNTIIYATGNNIGTFNSAGTHTIYYKPSANEYLRLRSGGSGFEGKISSITIKRVTNNIVAYYPLDGSSSISALSGASNNGTVGITNDLTTGETLGSELISANTTSEWNQYGSPSHNPPNDIREANTDNGVALTAGSDTRNSYRFVSGLTDGKLYKLNVDAYYSGSSDTVKIEIIPGSGSLFTPALTTTSTNYTIYFVKNSGTMYILGNGFNNGNVLYVENLSIKEVTSNTGVLL